MYQPPRPLRSPSDPRPGQFTRGVRRLLAGGMIAALVAGCSLFGYVEPSHVPFPGATCGGVKILIPGALPCDELVRLAIKGLQAEAPGQLDRGVVAVTVDLQGCPKQEVPPQLDCAGEDFVQLVTVTFGPAVAGGPIEPSLSVGLSPTTGRLLGIVNPLIRQAGGGLTPDGTRVVLTLPATLPAAILAQIVRLDPGRAVIAGGPAAVEESALAAIRDAVAAP